MELHLTVKKSGTNRRGDGPEPAGHWQQLTKVIRNAHRPVVFEVDSLIPDTRWSVREQVVRAGVVYLDYFLFGGVAPQAAQCGRGTSVHTVTRFRFIHSPGAIVLDAIVEFTTFPSVSLLPFPCFLGRWELHPLDI